MPDPAELLEAEDWSRDDPFAEPGAAAEPFPEAGVFPEPESLPEAELPAEAAPDWEPTTADAREARPETAWEQDDPFAVEIPEALLPTPEELADPFAALAEPDDVLVTPDFEAASRIENWAEEPAALGPPEPFANAPTPEEDFADLDETPAPGPEAYEATQVLPPDFSRAAAPWEPAAMPDFDADQDDAGADDAVALAAELAQDDTILTDQAAPEIVQPSGAATPLTFQFDPEELAEADEDEEDHTVIEDRRDTRLDPSEPLDHTVIEDRRDTRLDPSEPLPPADEHESLAPPPSLPQGVVTLRGWDDVLMRFQSQIEAERLGALRDAFNCGRPGLELILRAVKEETGAVQQEAERLVLERLQRPAGSLDTLDLEVWLRLDCIHILRGHSHWVQDVAIAPDGRTLVSGSKDGTLKLWDLLTGRETMTLHRHTSAVLSVALSPDGQQIISSSRDNTIRIWDRETGRQVRSIEGNRGHPIYTIAVSPDGQRLVSASADNNVKPTFDFSLDALLSRLPAETSSPLISTLKLLCRTQALRVWNLASGKPEGTLVGYSRGLTALQISPDGELVIAGSRDQTIQIWEFKTGKRRSTLLGHIDEIRSVALSPDGRNLVSGSRDRTIKIWDLKTGHVLRTLRGHAQSVTSVAISPDGQVVISGSRDGTVRIWNFHTGQHLHTLFGHSDLVRAIAISSDGRTIVSGSRDHTVRVWQSVPH